MVYNYMEEVVDLYLKELLHSSGYKDVCQCERCIDDIKARALNQITPFYVTGKKGEVFGKYSATDVQRRMDIIAAIATAIQMVGDNKHI